MTIAFVANQNDDFTDSIASMALAYGSNNTAGNLLVAFVDILDVTPPEIPPVFTITDTQGNLWETAFRLDPPLGDQTDTRCAALMYCRGKNTHSGANTVTLSTLGVTYNMGLAILEFSGLDPNNPLSTVVSYGYSSTVATNKKNPQIPALRPDYANSLVVIAVAAEDANPTVGTGWTDADDNNHLQVSYKISTTAGYLVPNWVTGTSNYYGGIAVTFHAGPANVASPKASRSRAYSLPQLALSRLPRIRPGVAPPAVTSFAATVAQRVGGLVQVASAAETFAITAAQRVTGLRQAVSATTGATTTAAIAQSLGGLRQSLSGAETFAGTVAQRIGVLRQALSGGEAFAATMAQRLGALRQALAASEAFGSTTAQHLGGLRQSAAGAETFAATSAQRLYGLVQAADGRETFASAAAQRLGGLRQSLFAGTGDFTTIAQRLSSLRQSATGAETFPSSAAQHVGSLRQSASSSESFPSTASQHLGQLTQTASVTIPTGPITSVIVQNIRGLGQHVTVTVTGIRPPMIQVGPSVDQSWVGNSFWIRRD